MLKAPGKIEEYISADDRILGAPEIKKSEYNFSYNLSYTLVKMMKDGKEYNVDNDIYNDAKDLSSVTVKNDDGTKVSENAVRKSDNTAVNPRYEGFTCLRVVLYVFV